MDPEAATPGEEAILGQEGEILDVIEVRVGNDGVLENGLPDGVVLNVNFPKMDGEPFKGIKICRQARANWVEEFDRRTNPQGKPYYWLTGRFVKMDHGEDTDVWALENGYISVVPVHFDLTAHHFLQSLNSWKLD